MNVTIAVNNKVNKTNELIAAHREERRKNSKKQRKQNKRKCVRKLQKIDSNMEKKKFKKERKGVVLKAGSCQFVDFDAVRINGKGCQDGTKMVLKNKY